MSGEHSIYGLEVSHFFDPSFSAMKFTPHHHRTSNNSGNGMSSGDGRGGGGGGSGGGEGCHRSPLHFLNQSGMSPGYFGLPTPLRKYIYMNVLLYVMYAMCNL